MKTKLITVAFWNAAILLLTLGSTIDASQQLESPELTYTQEPSVMDADVGMIVTVLVTLSAEGKVEAVELQRADAPRFAEAVKDAVWNWRFTPALRNGEKVPSKVLVPVRVAGPTPRQFTMR